jgi:hypothetical protein
MTARTARHFEPTHPPRWKDSQEGRKIGKILLMVLHRPFAGQQRQARAAHRSAHTKEILGFLIFGPSCENKTKKAESNAPGLLSSEL